MNTMIKKAVILAGGFGTRLRPLTYEIPKALIPLHGKTHIEHQLDLFKKYNTETVVLAVGHMKEKIENYLKDGKEFGISIEYIKENEPLGTAGALGLNKDKFTEAFFCINGDDVREINLEEMHEFHKKNNAMITIALAEVADTAKYGIAKLKENKILEFVEKPQNNPPSNLASTGLYIIEPEALNLIPEGFTMLEKDVFPKVAQMGKLFGYKFKGQWLDTGTREGYEKAIKEWKDIQLK